MEGLARIGRWAAVGLDNGSSPSLGCVCRSGLSCGSGLCCVAALVGRVHWMLLMGGLALVGGCIAYVSGLSLVGRMNRSRCMVGLALGMGWAE